MKFILSILLFFGTSYAQLTEVQKQGSQEINLLKNSGFENGKTGWIASGGSFTVSASDPFSGTRSATFNASAGSQYVSSIEYLITAGFEGKRCQVHVPRYTLDTGANTDYDLKVYNGEDEELLSLDVPVTAADTVGSLFQVFDCPLVDGADDSDKLYVRFVSAADGGNLKFDDVFLGTGRNEVNVSQAVLFGTIQWPTATSCSWSYTSSTFGVPSADADCTTPSVTGKATAPATKIPAVTIPYMPAGQYVVKAVSNVLSSGGANNNCIIRLHDGTNSGINSLYGFTARDSADANANGNNQSSTQSVFSYATAQTNKTISLQVSSTNNTTACLVQNNITGGSETGFVIEYYPLNSDAGTTYETSGWFVDANITGTSPSLGTSSVATAQEITGSSLTMVNNSGSLPATIPCSSTNPSTGLTCAAGNESLGVTFDLPKAGNVFACASFSHNYVLNNANLATTFSIVETGNANQTVLQTNNSRVSSEINLSSTISGGYPHTSCGIMKFSTSGKKTLRLFYEQAVSGTVTSSLVVTDAASAVYDRDFKITVFPIAEQMPAPVFGDYKNKVGTSDTGMVTYAANIVDSGTCSIGSQLGGSWVTSVTDLGTGSCRINFASGFFDGVTIPLCVASPGTVTELRVINLSATFWEFGLFNSAGTPTNGNASVICFGKK